MHIAVHRLAGAVALAASTLAGATPRYQPANLLGTGYSETALGADSWEIEGASAERDGGHAIALYRAAELVAGVHARAFRVIDQYILITTRANGAMFVREVATIKVKAIRSDADRMACVARRPERCLTVSVARMAARFGPLLGQPAVLPGVPIEPIAVETPPATARPTETLSPYEAGRRAARAALITQGMTAP